MPGTPKLVHNLSNYLHNLFFDRANVQNALNNIQQGWSVLQTHISPHKPPNDHQYDYAPPILSEPPPKRQRTSPFSDSPMRMGSPAPPKALHTPIGRTPTRSNQGLRSVLRPESRLVNKETTAQKQKRTFNAFRKDEMLDVESMFGYPSAARRPSNGVIGRAIAIPTPRPTYTERKRREIRPRERRMSLPVSTSRIEKPESKKQPSSRLWQQKGGFERILLKRKAALATRNIPQKEPVVETRVETVQGIREDRMANGTIEVVKESVMEIEKPAQQAQQDVTMATEKSEIDREKLIEILPAEFVDLIEQNPKLRQKVIKLHGAKMVEAWQAEMRMRKRETEIRAAEEERVKLKARRDAVQERWRKREDEDAVEEPFGDHFDTVYWEGSGMWIEEDDPQAERERQEQRSVEKEGSAFARLTPTALNRLRSIMWEMGDDMRELIKVNGCVITGEDLGRLRPHVWLNDEIVNAYLELLSMRNKTDLESGKKVPKIRVMNSFFYSKLVSRNRMTGTRVYDYTRVRRWTRRFDAFSYDMLFIPINESNTHWTLGVVNFRDKTVQHLDSMGTGGSMTVREHLLAWVRDEAADKNKTFVQGEWSLPLVDVPKQKNSDDCGVFLCKFADFLARGWGRFTFDQRHMDYFRSRIAHELLMGKAT